MMIRALRPLACLVLIAGAMPAASQTTTGAMPQDPAAEVASPRKMRPKAPRPAQLVTLTNATRQTAKEVVVMAEDQTARLAKPLAPKAKASLKMPKIKGCMVSVAAVFEGEGQVDVGDFDICKERTIRFTE